MTEGGAPNRPGRTRLVCLIAFTGTAMIVALGVLWQAFSIVAYIRGAGQTARDMHVLVAYIVHNTEIVVFLAALGAFWRDWRRIGFALLLPVYGTFQVFAIGDTGQSGGWSSGLHGLLALVVLLQATALTFDGARRLRVARAAPA